MNLYKSYTKRLLIAFCLVALMLPATLKSVHANHDAALKVTVTTSFLADIVQNIAGDAVDMQLLIPAGSDPHTYSAQAKDLEKILEADVILYHGLRFEAQIAELLEDYGHAVTRNFKPDDLIHVSESSDEVDPHYWFDIELYKQSVIEARDILSEALPDKADEFSANTDVYLKELDALADWTEEQLATLPIEQRILVTPHDAFSYFALQNEFVVFAPQGISTESEVANEQIVQTVDFILENQVPAIFLDTTSNPQAMQKLQEGVKQKGAEVVVVSGDNQELFSDSLAPQGQPFDNYIDMYQHNLTLILTHLVQ